MIVAAAAAAAATNAATATPSAPPAAGGLSFNWFDIVVLVMLLIGLARGRRNGMTRELLPALQWIVVVLGCALVYHRISGLLASFKPDPLWSCLGSYLAPALVIFLAFKIIKWQFAEKLVKTDFFKDGEYYLGMLTGLVRYACIMLFVLALLNAPVYTRTQIAQQTAFDKKNFGGGLFDGNYFPHLYQVQAAVFQQSFLGPLIKDHAGLLLINTGQSTEENTPGTNAPAPPPKPKPVIKIG